MNVLEFSLEKFLNFSLKKISMPPRISRCKKTGRKLSGYSNLMPLQQDYRPVWQLQGRFCALKGPSACWEREQLQSRAFKFKSLKEQTMSLHLGLANTYALPAGV